jgi:membrane protease YdiL (CAAX protease family)
MGSFSAELLSLVIGASLLYWPYIWCRLRKEAPETYGLVWDFNGRHIAATLVITAAVLALLTPVALVWPNVSLPHSRDVGAVLYMLAAGLAAAVIEETFFRGWLQTLFRRHMGAIAAIVAVNLIFAPVHLFHTPRIIALATFFPGLIMGALRERYKNVLPSIIFHFLGNVWSIWFFPM